MTHDRQKTAEQLEGEIAALREKVSALERSLEDDSQRMIALRRKEEVLHATLDSALDGILAVDETGHVVFSNREFAKMWHIPPDLIEAGDDNELLLFVSNQLADPRQFLAKVRELYESYQQSHDLIQFRDGRVFERYSLPLVLDNRLSGRVWTFRDITTKQTKGEHS